jgi:small subunit ribosomal protein S15
MSVTKEARQEIIKTFARKENDCGSTEVQVALMSRRIKNLTVHLASHKKDHSTRRGLLMLVGRRSKLLRYLARHDAGRYQTLIDSLGIRK